MFADVDGDFVVVREGNGVGDALGEFARRITSAGAVGVVEFSVNATTTGTQNLPAVAMDASGDSGRLRPPGAQWSGSHPRDNPISTSASEVTLLLDAIERGESRAADAVSHGV